MILTTDELKRTINNLEDGKYIMIGPPDKYADEMAIDKIVKKSSYKDNPYIWHYVLCPMEGR